MPDLSINLMEVVKEDGVKDLPLAVKGPFAKALIAERKGEMGEASVQLDKAVEAEQKPLQEKKH